MEILKKVAAQVEQYREEKRALSQEKQRQEIQNKQFEKLKADAAEFEELFKNKQFQAYKEFIKKLNEIYKNELITIASSPHNREKMMDTIISLSSKLEVLNMLQNYPEQIVEAFRKQTAKLKEE